MQKIAPPFQSATDLWFGNDVDLDGPYLVVSGPASGNRGGKAYLYQLGGAGWEYQTALAAERVHDSEYFYFGRNAAVSAGNGASPARVLVSSDGGGRVFEESSGGWNETALLPGFGDIDGSTAVSAMSGPAARIFRFENSAWTAADALAPTFPDNYDLGGEYGSDIVIDGAHVFVSAPSQDHSVSIINSGAVFAYEHVDGQLVGAKAIRPPDPIWRGQFGYGIDADNGRLLVGRPGGSPSASGPPQGIAYVYENVAGDWVETARLHASDGFPGDAFGAEVAISTNFAAIANWSGTPTARVYVFQRQGTSWQELGWLETGQPFSSDQFGVSLTLEGNRLAVGARLDSAIGDNAGAVYVYAIPEPTAWTVAWIGLAVVAHVRRRGPQSASGLRPATKS